MSVLKRRSQHIHMVAAVWGGGYKLELVQHPAKCVRKNIGTIRPILTEVQRKPDRNLSRQGSRIPKSVSFCQINRVRPRSWFRAFWMDWT